MSRPRHRAREPTHLSCVALSRLSARSDSTFSDEAPPLVDAEKLGASDSFDLVESLIFKYLSQRYWTSYSQSPEFARVIQFYYLQNEQVAEKDFTQFRVLGRGGFGLVYGCRKNTTGTMYAMKTMGKARVKQKNSEQLCFNERTALNEANSPFVVCLKYAFVTDRDLYLIIDLMMGGDLSFWLNQKHTFSKEEARYYAARTLLGIAHIHELGMVSRLARDRARPQSRLVPTAPSRRCTTTSSPRHGWTSSAARASPTSGSRAR